MSIYGNDIERVSDVLSCWNDGDGLVDWAASLGFSWREVRQHAAMVGTHTHEIIEATLKHWSARDLNEQMQNAARAYLRFQQIPRSMLEEVRLACQGWMQWANGKQIVVEALEEKLIDTDEKYGGTCDFKGLIDGKRCLLDWKTSKHITPRYKVQLAAYAMLHEKFHPEHPIDWYGVVRCDKTMGHFQDMYWTDLTVEKEMFKALLKVRRVGQRVVL